MDPTNAGASRRSMPWLGLLIQQRQRLPPEFQPRYGKFLTCTVSFLEPSECKTDHRVSGFDEIGSDFRDPVECRVGIIRWIKGLVCVRVGICTHAFPPDVMSFVDERWSAHNVGETYRRRRYVLLCSAVATPYSRRVCSRRVRHRRLCAFA